MEIANKISRQLILWIFIWFIILGIFLAWLGYWEMSSHNGSLSEYQGQTLKGVTQLFNDTVFIHLLAASLMATGFFLWLSLRFSVKRSLLIFKTQTAPRLDKNEKEQVTPTSKQMVQEREMTIRENQQRALQLLSLLQREGRLVDFLEENIESYDDAQIGAAVRNIQENCKKSLNEYLAPKAVIDKEEGEEVAIPAGFDAGAIKLTGNVTGEPPFRGILQHRGWLASSFDLPTLTGTQVPDIIAPAEVEIV